LIVMIPTPESRPRVAKSCQNFVCQSSFKPVTSGVRIGSNNFGRSSLSKSDDVDVLDIRVSCSFTSSSNAAGVVGMSRRKNKEMNMRLEVPAASNKRYADVLSSAITFARVVKKNALSPNADKGIALAVPR